MSRSGRSPGPYGSPEPAAPDPAGTEAVGLYGPRSGGLDRAEKKPRCRRCSKVLAWFVSPPWSIRCPRCGLDNGS